MIESLLAILVAVIAVLCGLLAFGSHFAIPLGWAALAQERSPDPLDSLSRGYEYLFRRPLHLIGYGTLALVLVLMIGGLATGVAAAGVSVSEIALGSNASAQSLVQRVAGVLTWLPIAVAVTLAWGLIGGVYLMLRCDAGGQEVEDIWMPPVTPRVPLPKVPNT